MTITTKEQLKEHIHSIHDYIRNNGAGYGMMAMKIFMIFYGLKIIEPIIDKTPLNPEICTFSKIKKNANKKYGKGTENEKDNPLSNFIDDDILDEIHETQKDKNNWKFFIFQQIPKGLPDTIWNTIIDYVNEIPTKKNKKSDKIDPKFDVDLSGKVYEYFIGRDDTAISELGAYFTVRDITNYIMNKVSPTLKNGKVRTMIDPFAGSGGFTLSYVHYLNEHFKEINWKKDINNIYHFDMNEDVIKIAGLEIFGLTEYLPNNTNNFIRVNTFKHEFGTTGKHDKYDYIYSNPPYGGDKNKKSIEQLKSEMLIDYITKILNEIQNQLKDDSKNKELLKEKDDCEKQISNLKSKLKIYESEQKNKKVNSTTCSKVIKDYIKKNDLKTCNDKEACSLVLFMALLNDDGVCAGVLKEGVFFDKKYRSIRKCLIENFNVKYVISVPQDQFENTSTKTSIVIFENTKKKTSEIIFYDLNVKKEKDDVIEKVGSEYQLVKCKDDIIEVVEKEVCRCTVDDMEDDYSLNYKNYLKNDIKVQEGFELVKLGNIIKYDKKSNRKASYALEEGTYNFYTSSEKIKKCNDADFKKDTRIILGTGGKSSLFIDTNFSCSADNFVLTTDNIIKTYYLYSYIKNNWANFVQNLSSGTTLSHINKENLNKYSIPFPNKVTMKKFEPVLKNLMKLHENIQKLSNDIPQKEKDIYVLMKKLTDEGKKGVDYDEYKLSDICEINPTSSIKKYDTMYYIDIGNCIEFVPTEYKYKNLPSRAKRQVKINDILVSSVRPANKNIQVVPNYNKLEKLLVSTGFVVLRSTFFHYYYIYLLVKSEEFTEYLIQKSTGSGYPAVKSTDFMNYLFKILNKKIIEKKLQPLFDEVDKMKDELEKNKKEHSDESLKFIKMIDPDYKQFENNITDTDVEDDTDLIINTTDKQSDKQSDSDISNSDTEVEDIPIKKKIIKKPSKKSDSDTEAEEVPIKKKTVKK